MRLRILIDVILKVMGVYLRPMTLLSAHHEPSVGLLLVRARADLVELSLLLLHTDKFHFLSTITLLDPTFERGVVMVLNVVISAARQVLRDFTPAVPVDLVQLQNTFVLLLRPLDLLDIWVQMVVPPTQTQRELGVKNKI